MEKIDLDKFVCDFMSFKYNLDDKDCVFEDYPKEHKITIVGVFWLIGNAIRYALKKQYMEYKDGKIQSIPLTEEQKSYIDDGLKNGSMARESDLLHPDDWYECIHTFLDEYGYPSFVIGEFANLGKILEMGVKEEQLKDYFRPCTECTKLSFPVDSQVFSKSLQIIGTVVKTYQEGCVVKEIGLQQFHHYNDLEPIIKLKNTDTIKFAKELDIDAMVEEYWNNEDRLISSHIRAMIEEAYRKGLEDMYQKLKGELV